MEKDMLRIRGLNHRFHKGQWALRDIELSLDNGIFGLLGPNGAGKSTLMRIMATLVKPTEGELSLDGVTYRKPEQVRRSVGYLPQSFQLYPQLTAGELMEHVAVMKGIGDARLRQRQIQQLLEEVNLADRSGHKLRTFSGGMLQRLGVAQALLGEPRLLIFDEPTTGLDPEERVRFRRLLARHSAGRIVILSTHLTGDVEGSCNHAVVLKKGKLARTGTLEQIGMAAEGRVWEWTVPSGLLAGLEARHIVVYSERAADGMVRCRLLSPICPGEGAIAVNPVFEDGYLLLIGGERYG